MNRTRRVVSATCFTTILLWCSAAAALPEWLTLRGDSCEQRFDVITVERLMQLNLPEDVAQDARVEVVLDCSSEREGKAVGKDEAARVEISVAHVDGTFLATRSLELERDEKATERTVATLAGELLGDWLSSWDRRDAALRGAGRGLRDAVLLSRGVASTPQVETAPTPLAEARSRAGWFAEIVPAGSSMGTTIQSGISAGAAYRDKSWLGWGLGAEWVSGGFETTIGALTTRRITLDAHLAFAVLSHESPWFVDPAVGARGGVLWSDSTSFNDFYGDRSSVLGWVSPFGRFAAGRKLFDPVWLGLTVEAGYPALGGVVDAVDEQFDFSLPWASAGVSLRVGPL